MGGATSHRIGPLFPYIEMDYSRIYDSLINRGLSRGKVINLYLERHHINPRCIGGSDEENNLVFLTPEEHYLAHQLLVKIHPGSKGLIHAAILMSTHDTHGRVNNKLFGWLRRRLAESQRGKPLSEEIKLKMSNSLKGRKCKPMSEEIKRKISESKRGKKLGEEALSSVREKAKNRVYTEETREKHRLSSTGRKHSEETKAKIAESNRTRVISEETRQKISKSLTGKKHGPQSEETRKKKSEARLGWMPSEVTRQKLRECNLGKIHTDEARLKMSAARKGVPKSDVHNKAVSEAKRGTKKVLAAPDLYKMINPSKVDIEI